MIAARNERRAARHGAVAGVGSWRVANTDDVEPPKSQPSARSLERGEDGAPLIPAKPHSGRPRPTTASRMSPPWSVAEGSAAAADVLARQREQPTGGYGTPKPVARCVPGRAQRSKPGRADIVPPSAVARPRRE
jgi:hypothetical protein